MYGTEDVYSLWTIGVHRSNYVHSFSDGDHLNAFFLLCFCRNNCCDARHSNWDQCVVRLRACECFVVWLSVFLHFCLPIDYYLELPFSLFLFWFLFLFLLHVFGHSRKRRHCLGFTFIHIYCG